LGRKLPVVPRRVDEQHLIAAFHRALLAQDEQTGRDARPVEHIERQRDHGIDESGVE
jgi:hypothetical protein